MYTMKNKGNLMVLCSALGSVFYATTIYGSIRFLGFYMVPWRLKEFCYITGSSRFLKAPEHGLSVQNKEGLCGSQ